MMTLPSAPAFTYSGNRWILRPDGDRWVYGTEGSKFALVLHPNGDVIIVVGDMKTGKVIFVDGSNCGCHPLVAASSMLTRIGVEPEELLS